MLTRSTDDSYINSVFPKTFKVYQKWDRQGLPPEEVYAAMFIEIKKASGFEIGKASTRMNYAKSGWKSMIKKSKLDLISGIGPVLKRRLLNKYKNIKSISKESIEDLMTLKGINEKIAKEIKSILNQ